LNSLHLAADLVTLATDSYGVSTVNIKSTPDAAANATYESAASFLSLAKFIVLILGLVYASKISQENLYFLVLLFLAAYVHAQCSITADVVVSIPSTFTCSDDFKICTAANTATPTGAPTAVPTASPTPDTTLAPTPSTGNSW
jgi:hypothetical protein